MQLKIKQIVFLLAVVSVLPGFSQVANFKISKYQACDELLDSITNTSVEAVGKLRSNYTFTWTLKKYSADGTDSVFVNNTILLILKFNKPGINIITLAMRENKAGAPDFFHTDTVLVRPHPNAWFTVADTFTLKNLKYRFLSGRAPTDTIKYLYKWYLQTENSTIIDSIINAGATKGIRDLALKEFAATDDGSVFKMYLTVSDRYGCKDNYSEAFLVSSKLIIPNVFTPNGDGVNDVFKVQTNGRNVYILKIFTSGGTLVYESESHNIEWDGIISSGSKALPGTYFYIIEPKAVEIAAKPYKGFVMLFRKND